MKKKIITNQKSLFNLTNDSDRPVKKKRGRPRKIDATEIKQNDKTVVKYIKNQEKSKVTKEVSKPSEHWKSFYKSQPELLVPCEFYVDTGTDKKDIFRGYIKEKGVTCTDEPYKLVVLRKKYGNLFYHEINGCESVDNCPDNFPHCEKCKIYINRNKKNE